MLGVVSSPAFLTVEEAAVVLRIGRTAAYEATRRWRATGGAEGIPVVRIGGTLRVPRRKLEEMAGGPIELESPTGVSPAVLADRRVNPRTAPRRADVGNEPVQTALRFGA